MCLLVILLFPSTKEILPKYLLTELYRKPFAECSFEICNEKDVNLNSISSSFYFKELNMRGGGKLHECLSLDSIIMQYVGKGLTEALHGDAHLAKQLGHFLGHQHPITWALASCSSFASRSNILGRRRWWFKFLHPCHSHDFYLLCNPGFSLA